jgi:heme/copper-type cytochrome/quinol oxidase subunit 1
MPRWSLVVLVVLGVVCAGIGVGLTDVFSRAPAFGWTAYSPLSKTVYSGSYEPIDPTWSLWRPRLGIGLLALGAGTTGAVAVALITTATRRRSEETPGS